MTVLNEILRPNEAILWDIYREITAQYWAAPTRANRALWETSYKKWREAYLAA